MANGVLQPGDIIPEALSWENFELTLFGAQVIKFSAFEFEFSSVWFSLLFIIFSDLPFLHADTEVKNTESGLESVKAECDAEVSRQMEVPGQAEINSHKIILDPDKSFARTKLLKARLTMYVAGRIDGISWETNFSAAAAQ